MQFASLFRRRAIMKAAGIVQLDPERPGVINMGQCSSPVQPVAISVNNHFLPVAAELQTGTLLH